MGVGAEAAGVGAEAVMEVEVEAVVEIVGDMPGDAAELAGDPGDPMRDDSSSRPNRPARKRGPAVRSYPNPNLTLSSSCKSP